MMKQEYISQFWYLTDCWRLPIHMNQMLIRNADVNEGAINHGQLNLVYPQFKWESERVEGVLHSINYPPLE